MNDGRHIIWTDDLDYDDWKADLEGSIPISPTTSARH